MDKLRKAIKCVDCLEILKSPVVLPCSHSICDKHVKIGDKKSIRCGECGLEHQIPENIGFPKNQALEDIIETKIDSLYFGKTHTEAKEECIKLDYLLKSIECLVNDPIAYGYEEINHLRNRVHIKSEHLKSIIDQKTEKVLNLLNEYKKKFENSLTNSEILPTKKISSYNYNSYNELRKKAQLWQSQLESWQNELNEVKFEDERWAEILRESKKTIQSLEMCLKPIRMDVMLSDDSYYRSRVDRFENIDIEYNDKDYYDPSYSD